MDTNALGFASHLTSELFWGGTLQEFQALLRVIDLGKYRVGVPPDHQEDLELFDRLIGLTVRLVYPSRNVVDLYTPQLHGSQVVVPPQ